MEQQELELYATALSTINNMLDVLAVQDSRLRQLEVKHQTAVLVSSKNTVSSILKEIRKDLKQEPTVYSTQDIWKKLSKCLSLVDRRLLKLEEKEI